jgi:hypothetical protein
MSTETEYTLREWFVAKQLAGGKSLREANNNIGLLAAMYPDWVWDGKKRTWPEWSSEATTRTS